MLIRIYLRFIRYIRENLFYREILLLYCPSEFVNSILLDYSYNYVEDLSADDNAAKNFNILIINLNIQR